MTVIITFVLVVANEVHVYPRTVVSVS